MTWDISAEPPRLSNPRKDTTLPFAIFVRWLVPAALFLTAVGCGWAPRTVEDKMYWSTDGKWPVDYVIEVKDDGTLHSQAARTVLAAVAAAPKDENLIVSIFVHGWHHNARFDSDMLRFFHESSRDLRDQLQEDIYAKSREVLTKTSKVRVISIYVAWRALETEPWGYNLFNFSSRKSAAERVGSGALRDFMAQLNDEYKKRNSPPEDGLSELRRPFMGLVAVGHSFGAQVLFNATSPILIASMTKAANGATMDNPRRLDKPIEGFGDMVVLLNPAFEAQQFKPFRDLSRTIELDRWQPPLLAVLSGTEDLPNRWLFSWARRFDGRYRSLPDDEKELFRTALGAYKPYVTHTVSVNGDITDKKRVFDPKVYEQPCEVLNFDLTQTPKFEVGKGSVALASIEKPARHTALVVADAEGLIGFHSAIFEQMHRVFLTNYAAVSQGKWILLRRERPDNC